MRPVNIGRLSPSRFLSEHVRRPGGQRRDVCARYANAGVLAQRVGIQSTMPSARPRSMASRDGAYLRLSGYLQEFRLPVIFRKARFLSITGNQARSSQPL